MSTLWCTCRDSDSVNTVWVQQQLVAPGSLRCGIGHESVMGDLATAEGVITHMWVWLGERGKRKSEAVHFATVSHSRSRTPTHTTHLDIISFHFSVAVGAVRRHAKRWITARWARVRSVGNSCKQRREVVDHLLVHGAGG